MGKDSWSSIGTAMAERSESFHPIRQWNALKQLSKRMTLEIPIQPNEIQMLPVLIHNAMNKGNQSRKKLGFIHQNHLSPINGKM